MEQLVVNIHALELTIVGKNDTISSMNNSLSGLIEALEIFLKYGDVSYPTHCEHDMLRVTPETTDIMDTDIERLMELGFEQDDDITESFISYRFGSN